jgi:hypothetical protein
MKNSTTNDPPLVIDREFYDTLLKDPLYGRLARVGIEIGRVIINDAPEETINDIQASLPEYSRPSNRHKKRPGASSSKGAKNPPVISEAPRLIYCENCGTASVHGAKFCYMCGTRLPGDTDAMSEITIETLLQVMHVDPLAGIVWGHWIIEGKAKLAPSPLLKRYLETHEKGLDPQSRVGS